MGCVGRVECAGGDNGIRSGNTATSRVGDGGWEGRDGDGHGDGSQFWLKPLVARSGKRWWVASLIAIGKALNSFFNFWSTSFPGS